VAYNKTKQGKMCLVNRILKVYVASSWRNERQQDVVQVLRQAGHEVYDFKNPRPGDNGFHWEQIDPEWKQWSIEEYRKALSHPVAESGFASDWSAMEWADTCVLVMPCGRSAHIEAGYFVGAGKQLVILLSDGEPELMYKMAAHVVASIKEALDVLASHSVQQRLVELQTGNSDGRVSGRVVHCSEILEVLP
jgi:hypothetical protein